MKIIVGTTPYYVCDFVRLFSVPPINYENIFTMKTSRLQYVSFPSTLLTHVQLYGLCIVCYVCAVPAYQ